MIFEKHNESASQFCLDYCTTLNITHQRPKLERSSSSSFKSTLFLPEGQGRQGVGGLRVNGYYKQDMTSKPLITIITIVFNGEKYIEKTILSVINQNYDNVEYIIIDGGSTDGTVNIIKKYEKAIDYWVSETDKGISNAFNKGIMCSTGSIIGLINADDYYETDVLSLVSKQELKKSPAIIYGKTYKKTVEGKKVIKKDSNASWCLRVPFSHCSSFSTIEFYEEIGLFSEDYKIAMDIDLLMRGKSNAKVKFLKVDKFFATQRDGGVSDSHRIKSYLEYFKASRNYCNLPCRIFFFTVKSVLAIVKEFR